MLLVIVGPTGVGKTKLSIKLAKRYDAIIINADAMQVYKGLDIGTAKITEAEKEEVPHYLIDTVDINTNYTVYDYQKDARKIIDSNRSRNIIIVGGTGLYIKALLYNYNFAEESSSNTYEGYSNEELYNLALKKDPNMKIHKNNRVRLVRFLNKEVITVEEPYPLYDALYIGLTTTRDNLYNRINKRVDEMFGSGLVEEAEALYKTNKDSKALHTAIGYKELIKYFEGEISLEAAKDEIMKNTRHYAKRQYTWFNNQMDVTWFDTNFENFNKTVEEVIEYIEGSHE